MTMSKLNKTILSKADGHKYHNVQLPRYDPQTLQGGIVHVGIGNFFRSHLAFYVHKVLNYEATREKENTNHNNKNLPPQEYCNTVKKWGIVGGSVTNHSYSQKRKVLQEQDMLYTLVQQDEDNIEAQIVASVIDCLPYQDDRMSLRKKLLDPATRIVTLTVTEGGYFLKEATQSFDADNVEIQQDIQNPDEPKTIFGLIVQTLKERRSKGIRPYTVMSCDNVPHNGDVTKQVVVGLAREMDQGCDYATNGKQRQSSSWIEENVCFPNSMVDRITPSIGKDKLDFIQNQYGYQDQLPVFCEPYHQWVLEDNFVDNDRPPFDKVGVQMVEDVTPWENMKLRILNGGHASLSYPAALMGLQYVHEAAGNETIGNFLDCLQRHEIIPVVPDVPGQDLNQYWETVWSRYKNPTLNDSIDRNCQDGSERQPKFIIQPIVDHLDRGDAAESVTGLALVSAMWCRYCQGTTEKGSKIEPNDKIWEELVERAGKAKENPQAWLQMEDIYGSLGRHEEFINNVFSNQMKLVNERGVEEVMKQYVESKQ